MKIKIVKDHHHYSLGVHDVYNDRGRYLISAGIAEEVPGKISNESRDEIRNKILEAALVPKKILDKENKISPAVIGVKKSGRKKKIS